MPPNTGGLETYADAARSQVFHLATLRGRQLSSGAGRSGRREEEEEKPTGSLGKGGGGGGRQEGRRSRNWELTEKLGAGGGNSKEGWRHRRFGEKARVNLGDCEWLTFLGCRQVGA